MIPRFADAPQLMGDQQRRQGPGRYGDQNPDRPEA